MAEAQASDPHVRLQRLIDQGMKLKHRLDRYKHRLLVEGLAAAHGQRYEILWYRRAEPNGRLEIANVFTLERLPGERRKYLAVLEDGEGVHCDELYALGGARLPSLARRYDQGFDRLRAVFREVQELCGEDEEADASAEDTGGGEADDASAENPGLGNSGGYGDGNAFKPLR